MINSILIKYGEIALRGKNREKYERMLMAQINKALGQHYTVKREQGRFIAEAEDMEISGSIERMCKIPGVHSVCPCIKTKKRPLQDIIDICVEYVRSRYSDKNYTFKVKTKRADKSYELSSNEISAEIGDAILNSCSNLRVNVTEPEFTLTVELRTNIYIYSEEIRGYGGLPVSSSGKALCLLSGGIDSPVAAFMTSKRGVAVEFIYFHSSPYVSVMARQKVIDLAERLSEYLGETKLNIVNFTEVQEYLRNNVPEDKLTIFMKRSMISIAEMYAEKNRMLALVVGDSIGQVASQTLHAINAIDSAADMPVLRPLAGFNKQETVDMAKTIGTFEISIQPYEDCCTVFVPKHPETKPKRSVIEAIERSLDMLSPLKRAAFESIEVNTVGAVEHV